MQLCSSSLWSPPWGDQQPTSHLQFLHTFTFLNSLTLEISLFLSFKFISYLSESLSHVFSLNLFTFNFCSLFLSLSSSPLIPLKIVLFLSLFLSPSLSLSLYIILSPSISPFLSLCIHLSHTLSSAHSLHLTLYLFCSLYLSLQISSSLSSTLCISLPFSLSALHFSLFRYLTLSHCFNHSLPFPLSRSSPSSPFSPSPSHYPLLMHSPPQLFPYY